MICVINFFKNHQGGGEDFLSFNFLVWEIQQISTLE